MLGFGHGDGRGSVSGYSGAESTLADALAGTPWQVRRRRRDVCKLITLKQRFCSHLLGPGIWSPEGGVRGAGRGGRGHLSGPSPPLTITSLQPAPPTPPPASQRRGVRAVRPPLRQLSSAGKRRAALTQVAGRLGACVQIPRWPRLSNVPSASDTPEGASRVRVSRCASVHWVGPCVLAPGRGEQVAFAVAVTSLSKT